MKKRFYFISVLVLSVICLAACSVKVADNDKLSELRNDLLKGEGEIFSVSAVTGLRETDYEINGESDKEKSAFTVITVCPKEYNPLHEYSFKTTIGGEEYMGSLLKHPYKESYSAEITVMTDASELVVTVFGSAEEEIVIKSVKAADAITADRAYEIARKELAAPIKEKGDEYEFYVRFIENPINENGGYFWYVAFTYPDETTYATLIEPVTMEIVARRDGNF